MRDRWKLFLLPQMEITANTAHDVQSGRYLMKTKAIRAAMKIKYACWSLKGPFQWMQIIPTTPRFHIIRPRVM